jgi:hypothetical protein
VATVAAALVILVLVAQARDPLDGCTRTPNATGAQFKCGALLASVSALGLKPANALATMFDGLTASLGAVTAHEERFSVAGKSGPMRVFEFRKASSPRPTFTGRIAAVDGPTDVSWVVMCGFFASADATEATARCDEILKVLAAGGPAPFVVQQTVPKFFGRALPVPEQCSSRLATERSLQIACPDGGLTLSTVDPGTDLKKAGELMMSALLKQVPGAKEVEPRKCRVEGVEVSCRVAQTTTWKVFLALRPMASGATAAVVCEQSAATPAVHPACSSVLSL